MSTEQIVELDKKSTRLIEKLTKAMGKAANSFKTVNNRVPTALSGASSGSITASSGLVHQLYGLKNLFTKQLLPAINYFAYGASTGFQMMREQVGYLAGTMKSFLTNTNQQMSNFNANLGSGNTLIKRKKEETGKLEKYMNKFNLAMDTFNNLSDLSSKLTKKGKNGLTLFGGAMGKARGATGALTGVFRVLSGVLRATPLTLFVGALGAAAIAGRESQKRVGRVPNHHDLIRNDENFNNAAQKIDRYAKNLNVLDLNQLQGMRGEVDAYIKTLKNKALDVDFQFNTRLKEWGIKESDIPSDMEIVMSRKQDFQAFDRPVPKVYHGEAIMAQSATRSMDDATAALLLTTSQVDIPQRTPRDRFLSGRDRHVIDDIMGLRQAQAENRKVEKGYQEILGKVDARINDLINSQNPDAQLGLANGANTIAAGGKKTTHITINLDKMVENIAISADRLEEGLEEVEAMVKEVFLRVLNSGNYAAQ